MKHGAGRIPHTLGWSTELHPCCGTPGVFTEGKITPQVGWWVVAVEDSVVREGCSKDSRKGETIQRGSRGRGACELNNGGREVNVCRWMQEGFIWGDVRTGDVQRDTHICGVWILLPHEKSVLI